MTSGTDLATRGWEIALERFEHEHGMLELTPLKKPSPDEPDGWRGRLLKLEAGTIVVEAPKPGEGASIEAAAEAGNWVTVLMQRGDQRWSLGCRIIERFRFPVDALGEVEAVRLSRPERVDDAQRRRHFRAATVASTVSAVDLWRLENPADCVPYEQHNRRRHLERPGAAPGEDEAPAWPSVGQRWRGLIVDISGGGLNAALPRDAEALVRDRSLLWAGLPLPEMEEPLYAVARVVRSEPQTERVLRVGLEFSFEHHPRHERFVIDRLCYYTSFLQRLRLQKRKGRGR